MTKVLPSHRVRCLRLDVAMTTLAEALERASDYHRAGDLARAAPLYRQAVQADPANAAWRLLGETYQALGRSADAAASYR